MDAGAIYDLLLSETNVLLYGPPGTGKTHLVQEVANLFKGQDIPSGIFLNTELERDFLQRQEERRCKIFWVTFHQSYSYDNFVIGLRLDIKSDIPLTLKPEPGVLLQAAAYASRVPGILH